MVAYNFQPWFATLIVRGRKTSTLRRPRAGAGHARVGQMVHAFTGLRGPDCQRLLTAPCILSRGLELHASGVVIGGERVDCRDFYETLADQEGFDYFGDLQAWFDRRYGLPVTDLTQICWDYGQATDLADLADCPGGVAA